MKAEIERKFLVNEKWHAVASKANGIYIAQGYLNSDISRTVRVRIKGEQGYLTIKGKNNGISRQEFEYPIPLADAKELLKLCPAPIIEKTRYILPLDNLKWEIDVFHGANDGLIIAEIELPTEDYPFNKPKWIEKEVSDDPRYYNSSLAKTPFSCW